MLDLRTFQIENIVCGEAPGFGKRREGSKFPQMPLQIIISLGEAFDYNFFNGNENENGYNGIMVVNKNKKMIMTQFFLAK